MKPKNGVLSAAVEPSKLSRGVGALVPKLRCTTESTPGTPGARRAGRSLRAAMRFGPLGGLVAAVTSRNGLDRSFFSDCLTFGVRVAASAETENRKRQAIADASVEESLFTELRYMPSSVL